MKKSICYLVFILVLLSEALAQDVSKDSINIKHFGAIDYGTSSYNYSTIEDENGIIYVANENGILEYDGSEWKLIRLKDNSSAISLKLSSDGKIYVGGYNEFGYLERNESGQFEYYSLRDLLDPKAQMKEVWQIIFFEDQVYFQSYEYIVRFDGEIIHSLPVNDAYLLPINGQLYLSTYSKGMAIVRDDSINYISGLLDLDNDAAFKLLPGPEGKQLVLSENSGIFLLDTTTLSFEKWNVAASQIFKKHGLYDGMVWNDSTYLFVTIKNGIVWVSSDGKPLREINQTSGLSSNDLGALLRDSKGNLWLPNYGINYLSWSKGQKSENCTTIVRYVEIGDSTIYVNTSSGQILPDAQSNSFVFHFATPGFNRSELEYSYYLEGFDHDWSAWRNNIKKEYTNLGNRAYIFHVKARLLNGIISSPASISFIIPGFWYQNFWVHFFGMIMLVVIIWVGILLRLAHLKSLNEKLERVIYNRTKELVEQKEQLRSINDDLTVANSELDNFVYRSSHDLVAPLKSLSGLINIARIEKSEAVMKSYFEMMDTSIDRLEKFIKSILEYSSNSKGNFEQSNVNLNKMLDVVVADLKYFEQAETVELKRDFDENTSFVTDPKRFKIIISNLIANAVKYHNYNQPNPHIKITASKDKEDISISIIDNGKGIDSQHLDKIFDMFYRASENSEGSGLGLYIVEDTVHKLNGQIGVESVLYKGTMFTLKFPLKIFDK